MRIVHGALFNRAFGPTERGFALDAPHLVAAVDFRNAQSTCRAGARILAEFFDGGNILRFAFMFVPVPIHDADKTFGACELGTQVAFILGREHAPAPVVLALHDKLASGFAPLVAIDFATNFVNLSVQLAIFFIILFDFSANFGDFLVTLGLSAINKRCLIVFLRFRYFAIGQDGAAMGFVVFVHKRRVECAFGEFQAPFVAAVHAMGVGRHTRQVSSHTLFAPAE
jgi:hypothetical protein